jgi:serine/threonine protein kinase
MDLDLEEYLKLKRSALPPYEVIMVGKSLADALQVMHAFGIVHRDLTLDNVLLRTNDDKTMMMKCKVSDFGIARRSGFTMTGVAGKPGWIAPELHQADGGIAQPTREADIYSFGLVRLFTLPPSAIQTREDLTTPITTTTTTTPKDYVACTWGFAVWLPV